MNRDLNPQKAGSDSKPPRGRLQAGQPSVTFCGKETQRNIINTKLSIYEFIPVSSSAAVEFAGFHSFLITPPHIF